jgi:hypothetical protein
MMMRRLEMVARPQALSSHAKPTLRQRTRPAIHAPVVLLVSRAVAVVA